MQVTLVNLSSLPILGNRPVYPVGVVSVANALRSAGISAEIVDFVERPKLAKDLSWARERSDLIGFAVRDVDPIDIGAPTFVTAFAEFARAVRSTAGKGVRYIGGGAGFSLFAQPLAKRLGVSLVVEGEGEAAVESIIHGAPFRMAPQGIRVVSAPYRAFASRRLQHPRSLVRAYLRSAYPEIGVETRRRVCVKKCSYCPYAFLQRGTLGEFRDLTCLEQEIRELYQLGVRSIFFTDAVFNNDLPFAKRVCALLSSMGLHDLRWSAYFVPSSFDDELAELLVASGNRHVIFSPDSFDGRMMTATGKLFTMRHVRRARELCRRHNIDTKWLLLFGTPWEDRAAVRKTARYANRHFETGEIDLHVGIRILPGTRIAADLHLGPEDLLEPIFYPIRPDLFDWIFQSFDSRFFEGSGFFRHMAQRAARSHLRRIPTARSIERELDYVLAKTQP